MKGFFTEALALAIAIMLFGPDGCQPTFGVKLERTGAMNILILLDKAAQRAIKSDAPAQVNTEAKP